MVSKKQILEELERVNSRVGQLEQTCRMQAERYDEKIGKLEEQDAQLGQKYGEEIYDEIEHDVYSMEWKFSSIAILLFYLNAKTSALHSIYLRDASENMNEEKSHFDLFIYPDESFVSSLEDEYETLKSVM